MIGSCKNFAYVGDEMILCRLSRAFALWMRIWRRMSASSWLAASAISSSLRMELVMRSSRCRLAFREKNSGSRHESCASVSA